MSHPDERDLINLAREQLGRKKRERILEHCRGCRPCADSLIDLVREHGPPPAPMRLTRWHKISIALLVASLLALVLVTAFWVRTARRGVGLPPTGFEDVEAIEDAAAPGGGSR